ncbi:DHA2 family efflux MFS transporter permease subunit [Solidesulfovibrio sp.]|uniref:DHA2 family efflux MFS transporter permease subunit n=1 Tax=Solidesulfovibrio sp. TaxID=2910990 RepID=UPI002622B673|nr:DHA2 family efflux MFS transporter permease subunit [Solidesulfovibrio sp.]
MATPSEASAVWQPRVDPWLIAAAVMLATFMEVLDTSVANVALPYIAGNLSATQDESTWVLTSYLVSNAIVLPMTGWLSTTFGRKRFLMTCVAGFTLASAACGAAPTMAVLVLARVVQGAAGGALQPLSQAILMESFPPQKRGMAMAVFGMGVVVAPIVGPLLGGWITDNMTWRWIFFINLPVGVAALLMCQTFLEDPPYLSEAKSRRAGKVDYVGFFFMVAWLSTLQIVLDRGQEVDWFAAQWIRWFSGVSLASMIAFVVWELRAQYPLVDLRVLRDRDFAACTAMIGVVGVVLYSAITLLPLFMQTLMGYSAFDSGMALSPRGVGAIVAMILVGRIIGKVDTRVLIGLGFTLMAYSSYRFTEIDLDISIAAIIWPSVLLGLSMAMVFVPLTTQAMSNLQNEQIGNAAGIFNLMRNIGGSIGISALIALVDRGAQTHQALLAGHLRPDNPRFSAYLDALQGYLSRHADPALAKLKALGLSYDLLVQQATLLAYVDSFRVLAYLCLFCIPGVLLLRRAKKGVKPVMGH